jgi:hypothetical protein
MATCTARRSGAAVRGIEVLEYARELEAIAEEGLQRQHALADAGNDERVYLERHARGARRRRSPARDLAADGKGVGPAPRASRRGDGVTGRTRAEPRIGGWTFAVSSPMCEEMARAARLAGTLQGRRSSPSVRRPRPRTTASIAATICSFGPRRRRPPGPPSSPRSAGS